MSTTGYTGKQLDQNRSNTNKNIYMSYKLSKFGTLFGVGKSSTTDEYVSFCHKQPIQVIAELMHHFYSCLNGTEKFLDEELSLQQVENIGDDLLMQKKNFENRSGHYADIDEFPVMGTN